MFHNLQLEVMNRFTAVEQYFRVSLPDSGSVQGNVAQTLKGLVFVQIYAIHEYTVLKVVQYGSDAIMAHSHCYSNLRPSLLALFLDPQLAALRDCGPNNIWARRLDLLDLAVSNKVPSLPQAPLPSDGNHFRHAHLNLILRVFGIDGTVAVRRQEFRIDEVVNNRNSISHGGETAAEVGRRYSHREIHELVEIMREVCLRLIAIVSEHCNDPEKHRR